MEVKNMSNNNKNKMSRNKMTTKLNWRANNFGLKRDVLKLICEVQNRRYEYSLKHLNDPFYHRVGKWHRLYQYNSHSISVIKLQDTRIIDDNGNMTEREKQRTGKLVYEMLLGQETWTFETWKEMKNFITSGEMDQEFWQRCEQEDDDHNYDYDYDLIDQEDGDREEYESNQVNETEDDLQVTKGHAESDENIVTSTKNDIGYNNTGGV